MRPQTHTSDEVNKQAMAMGGQLMMRAAAGQQVCPAPCLECALSVLPDLQHREDEHTRKAIRLALSSDVGAHFKPPHRIHVTLHAWKGARSYRACCEV